MSVPNNSDGQPSVPQSTPAQTSGKSPATDRSSTSGVSGSWSTIPGLGSAVRPHLRTPQYVNKGGPLSDSIGQFVPPACGSWVPPMKPTPSPIVVLPAPRSSKPPPKTADTPSTDWQKYMNKDGATSTAAGAVPTSASTSTSRPLQGLGGVSQSFSGTKTAPISAKATSVKYTQTEEYHNSAVKTICPPTAKLPQTGLYPVSDPTASERDDSTTGTFTEPTSSEASIGLSEHYLKQHPEQAEFRAPTWVEAVNPRSIRCALKDTNAEWQENHPGALQRLGQLNPPEYLMPFGTRVVNIKTDYEQNIITSIRVGKYSVMEKVSDRIMAIYKAREDPREKVIFLFSVNGSKKFCGLAEMCGSWDPLGTIQGWQENEGGAKVLGTIPLTWVFAKDVAYSSFHDIRQIHNGHPVGNMWNGMNFPGVTGREVIERYVSTPSTASALGFPRNYPENGGIMGSRGNAGNPDTRLIGSQRGRGNFALRGGPRVGRGGSRGGSNISNWRHHSLSSCGTNGEQFEDDPTPTAATAGGRFAEQKNIAPTFTMEDLKNAPMAENTTVLPGESVSFVMGQDGRLMAVPVSTVQKQLPPASTSSDQQGTIFGGNPAQNPRMPSVNPLPNRGGMGPRGRGGHHNANGRPSQGFQPTSWMHPGDAAYAARPRAAGHEHSPSVAVLHQAAIYAAQQEAYGLNNYPPAHPSLDGSWGYHAQQMASLGFQKNALNRPVFSTDYDPHSHQDSGNNAPNRPVFSTDYDPHSRQDDGDDASNRPAFSTDYVFAPHMRHDSGDDHDALPTPTHRPPPHATRYEILDSNGNDENVTPAYRQVPGWQGEIIQGMGHLQLKALFFTLAAEQQILEHLTTQPAVSTHRMKIMQARMRQAVELKDEIHQELYFLGHTLANDPLDQGSNPYEQFDTLPNGLPKRSRISPMRDANGRRIPSVSETSRSPPGSFDFGMPQQLHQQHHQQHPSHPHNSFLGHQQHHPSIGGGVRLN